ncbi:GntR family transcriptional regulator [Arenibacter sp. F26102]|uniref:GntR family transcriptional regulator n=1 Tax=Arenibacter sp. F26102 TaxID=2926416 RepID=UPI001FF24AF7|nr:GntR family transcriptional regulator [Arenibacter sp. F26102]MCK0148252.1 GntR family transcriptional regulator [Arenibacter sp. F26102]
MNYSKLILEVYNKLLDDILKDKNIPRGISTESELAKKYAVSRSTIRKIMEIMYKKTIAVKDGSNKILLRLPEKGDYFSKEEVKNSKSDQAERAILKKLYKYDLKPSNRFSELELAREFNMNTISIREALIGISQTGLITKRSGQKWEVVALTQSKISQLVEFRFILEMYAMDCFKNNPLEVEKLKAFQLLLQNHKKLIQVKRIDVDDFFNLEEQFHYTLVNRCQNEFIIKSYRSLFILISYHIGQIKYDSIKIKKVLGQHIDVLEAILDADFTRAKKALQSHLDHAGNSMREVNICSSEKKLNIEHAK